MAKKKSKTEDGRGGKKKGRPRRRLWRIAGGSAAVLLVIYLAVFHWVRGERIPRHSSPQEYKQAVHRLGQAGLTIRSQMDMEALGLIACRAVREAAFSPGSFRVRYMSRLDLLEKVRHLLHSPFTGLETIYADIWVNSCTVYGHEEPTWGIRRSHVIPADKLSILIILIDRLKRGKSAVGEHVGAYREVFTGMKLDTLTGRASCYAVLMSLCARDRELAALVERHLRRRTQNTFDETEAVFWNYMANQPARHVLERLAGSEVPPVVPHERRNVNPAAVFRELLKDYARSPEILELT